MNESMIELKATITAALTVLGTFLGWKGIMAVCWVVVMALDYISGTIAACSKGEWSSGVARSGLWHKAGMILVVAVSAIADAVMAVVCSNVPIGLTWPGIILPLVLAWYIITELGSILENAVRMGAHVPGWLTKILKASLNFVDAAGDSAAGTEEEADVGK